MKISPRSASPRLAVSTRSVSPPSVFIAFFAASSFSRAPSLIGEKNAADLDEGQARLAKDVQRRDSALHGDVKVLAKWGLPRRFLYR